MIQRDWGRPRPNLGFIPQGPSGGIEAGGGAALSLPFLVPGPPGQKGNVMAEQTFGQKAVGLSFNPSQDGSVQKLKLLYAEIIDELNSFRTFGDTGPEHRRLASIAITEAQGAQMWAVKAVTWRD